MRQSVPETAVKMRALAAQLRSHAAETSMDVYRRKFEGTASELEEAAVNTETRAQTRNH
jgi:hypothetical protein